MYAIYIVICYYIVNCMYYWLVKFDEYSNIY